MARIGAFDAELRQIALFDATLVPEGWFSDDLIGAPAAASGVRRFGLIFGGLALVLAPLAALIARAWRAML
jgi:hypothetical protein